MAIGVGMINHALRAGLTPIALGGRRSPPWVIKATAANLATYIGVPECLLVTHTGQGPFRIFAAQIDH
jgi:hypothetical protein